MARRPRSRARLDRLLDDWEPRLRNAFLASIARVRNGADYSAIVRALERGEIETAVRAVGLNPASFRPFDLATGQAFEAAGAATARVIPAIVSADGLRTVFEFNIRNPAAERFLAERSGTAIREIVADQREMIRGTLRDALSRGVNPRTAALDLVGRINRATGERVGGMIGLTASQAEWVRNYEAELRSASPLAALERSLRDRRFDPAVRRAAAAGEPLTETQIESMVATYRNRALRFRAEAIGRTEAMTALHEAQEQAVEQAVEEGFDRENVRFVWHTAGDDRVRELHEPMDGQEIGMGEEFEDAAGNRLRYPGDPSAPPETTINCRCWREVLGDFLADID